ncbi:uncharacterized protein H6S33_007987 [Morchella sextelata]|uniref:uncharacterized protein n=1 Tax=Morchella sextelata TaxID=1174677 RepID=UPI001D052CBB|nr:uncharacterized protein H6S33_007987 [Morchella sextelata]KAH0602983.1 hypothetical protein H6S33_007987 [Morchella sextelata]
MFRRNIPSGPPPSTPPPHPPAEVITPVREGATTGRSAAPSPRTPEAPRGGTSLSNPDTPRPPLTFSRPSTFTSLANPDRNDTEDSDSDSMDWADAPSDLSPATPPARTLDSYTPSGALTPQTRAQTRDDLIHRLTSLISYPTPPTYALMQHRMSQIRTLSTTLTLFSAANPPDPTTADNTLNTPLDTLILSEYQSFLAREAAIRLQIAEPAPDPATVLNNDAAVRRAVAEFTIRLRSMMGSTGDTRSLYTAARIAAGEAVRSMLPGGAAWAQDEAGFATGESPRRVSGAAQERPVRRQFMVDGNGEALQGSRNMVGNGFVRREALDVTDSIGTDVVDSFDSVTYAFGNPPTAASYRLRFPTLTEDEIEEELARYERQRMRRSRVENHYVETPRSAGVSSRVWPDARTMTAEEIAEYNRVARREDREEDERIEREREEQRARNAVEEERNANENVRRRLRVALEEGMRWIDR